MAEFLVESPSKSSSITHFECRILEPKVIRKRFFKQVGIALGLAFASIFLPIAHFVLVPGFLIVAFFIGQRALNGKLFIGEGRISCPQCHREFEKKASIGSFPLRLDCQLCSVPLTIRENL